MKRALKWVRGGAIATGLACTIQLFGSLATAPGADALNGDVRATTRVNVRAEATTNSRSLTVLDPGDEVVAHGTSNGWTEVTWNGQTAYVYSSYLTTSTGSDRVVSSSAAPRHSYTTANLNVRSGPTLNDRVVAVASRGTIMDLTGRISGSYSQVVWQGQERWVASRYLSVNTPAQGADRLEAASSSQTTANLNIRVGASTSYRSVGVVPRGTVLGLTGKTQQGFSEVVWQGNTRWVASRYLRGVSDTASQPGAPALPSTTKRYATGDLNVWYNSTGNRYSTVVRKGAELQVTGKIENGRAQIVHQGVLRWVTARYTSTDAPGSTPPTPSPGDRTNTPPITGGPRGEALNKGYSSGLHRTNQYIQRIAADVWHRFPEISTQYGWRRDVTPDHPAGRAVDVMIPNYRSNKALGNEIAEYYRKHAKELNISYIIWDQKIWSVARDREGWRKMADRGGDSANHLDHVHINSN